jgi:uncharacterized OB-fold protein
MRCGACRSESAPPQPLCPYCGADDALERRALPSAGRLYSFTIVHVPPEGHEAECPYALGIVELEGGARITARIEAEDLGRLAIDLPLELARAEGGVFFFALSGER